MHLLVFERQKRNRKMGDKGEDSLVCRKCGRLTEEMWERRENSISDWAICTEKCGHRVELNKRESERERGG